LWAFDEEEEEGWCVIPFCLSYPFALHHFLFPISLSFSLLGKETVTNWR